MIAGRACRKRWLWGQAGAGESLERSRGLPMLRGGAVSMRWAGRLWAGPDGLPGLRVAVCALQTLVEETTIDTASPRVHRTEEHTRHGRNCDKTKRTTPPRHLGKHDRRRRRFSSSSLHPCCLPALPTQDHLVTSFWWLNYSPTPRREPRPPIGPPSWPTLPLSDARKIYEESSTFFMNNPWSPFLFSGNS